MLREDFFLDCGWALLGIRAVRKMGNGSKGYGICDCGRVLFGSRVAGRVSIELFVTMRNDPASHEPNPSAAIRFDHHLFVTRWKNIFPLSSFATKTRHATTTQPTFSPFTPFHSQRATEHYPLPANFLHQAHAGSRHGWVLLRSLRASLPPRHRC